MIQVDKVSSLFWEGLNLKLFLVNDRGPHIPNLWGLCSVNLHPVIIANSSQQISISLDLENHHFFICAVYAHTNYLQRRQLWEEINSVMHNFPGAWCCVGDFNVVLGANECRGSNLPARLPCDEFQHFTDGANLTHILTRGAEFTWTNRRRGSAHTEKRLDRSICNDDWLSVWNHTMCCSLPRICSDHHPLLICSSSASASRIVPFRFHNMWIQHHDCRRLVAEMWNTPLVGCPMFILSQKLKLLKKELRTWNKTVFGNVHDRVKNASALLDSVQNLLNDLGQIPDLIDQEAIAQRELLDALSEISSHVLSYYSNLYASPNNITPNSLIDSVIPNLVTEDDNVMLSKPPLSNEIKSAVFALNGEGAPGPDGFGGCFFQTFWDIVHSDVCNSVLQFFHQDWLLPNLNSNAVVLIPKSPGADKIEDFRPIALANFQFKIITKILADRLAKIAPKIVSRQQRGFIKDRHIQDCICIASEAINLLDHKTLGGNLAIKLDIKKAFDTLDWDFLLATLKAFGFSNKFTMWVSVILQSANCPLLLMGKVWASSAVKEGLCKETLSPPYSSVLLKMFSVGGFLN
ncbi:PREDICTED: uncharacterized protein LOC109339110 [Lupinus angustifolius]|uniref:uncharacterized protein LOC109339110 n=1 Tax=Lupinus angustifolius TaxID=3871 RepID=UPI00092E9CEF|nr:PREDICTED: uncharacterized protein LOC109339110 [Lupinus angustifolius]